MSSNGRAEDNAFSIYRLAKSVQSYLEYRISQSRDYSLDESSIKDPFSEYIQPYKVNAELEYPLNYFKPERSDIMFKLKEIEPPQREIPYFFEFKFAQDGLTRNTTEQQRVFDDLMRLNSIDDVNSKKYFLMAGSSIDFFQHFQYLTPYRMFPEKAKPCPLKNIKFQLTSLSGMPQTPATAQNLQLILSCANNVVQANPVVLLANAPSPCPIKANFVIDCPLPNVSSPHNCTLQRFSSSNVYNAMFSFDISNPKRTNLANDPVIQPLIDVFKTNYESCCIKKNTATSKDYDAFIDDIKNIETNLCYITSNDCLAHVAIWEITKATP